MRVLCVLHCVWEKMRFVKLVRKTYFGQTRNPEENNSQLSECLFVRG